LGIGAVGMKMPGTCKSRYSSSNDGYFLRHGGYELDIIEYCMCYLCGEIDVPGLCLIK
jgi:hypothetical protein